MEAWSIGGVGHKIGAERLDSSSRLVQTASMLRGYGEERGDDEEADCQEEEGRSGGGEDGEGGRGVEGGEGGAACLSLDASGRVRRWFVAHNH